MSFAVEIFIILRTVYTQYLPSPGILPNPFLCSRVWAPWWLLSLCINNLHTCTTWFSVRGNLPLYTTYLHYGIKCYWSILWNLV